MYKHIEMALDLKNCSREDGMAMLDVLNIFSGKWKMIIVCLLFDHDIRFSEIQRFIPSITRRTLSKELKELELNGIVKRTVVDANTVKYGITESALGLKEKIIGLVEWGVQHRKTTFAS